MSLDALNWALSVEGLRPSEKFVLVVLSNYTSKKSKKSWPSFATLAKLTGLSRGTVIRCVSGLCKKGLLEVEKRQRENGSSSSNAYKVMQGGVSMIPPKFDHETTPVAPCNYPSVIVTPLYDTFTDTFIDTFKELHADACSTDPLAQEQDKPMKKSKPLKQIIAELDKDKPESTAEALEVHRLSGKGYSPMGLFVLWKGLHAANHTGFVFPTNAKDLGGLKSVGTRLEEQAYVGMAAAIENWSGFTAYCEANGQAFNVPDNPYLPFWIKYADLSVAFAVQNEQLGEDEGEVDPISKPLHLSAQVLTNESKQEDNVPNDVPHEASLFGLDEW